jgi:hypothetical protein
VTAEKSKSPVKVQPKRTASARKSSSPQKVVPAKIEASPVKPVVKEAIKKAEVSK